MMTEFRPSRFQILPIVIKNLIIINGLVFLAQITVGEKFDMTGLFALHTWQSNLFEPWQFITHMFMHGNFAHILFNMFALWMFGSVLENVWGPKRFFYFYMVCGLGAALAHMIVLYYEMKPIVETFNSLPYEMQQQLLHNPNFKLNEATLGASGAVFGCLAAFGYLFPNATLIIFPLPFPIKAKWAVLGYAAIELISALQSSAGDDVAHVAHLGGALVGFLIVYFWNKNKRSTLF